MIGYLQPVKPPFTKAHSTVECGLCSGDSNLPDFNVLIDVATAGSSAILSSTAQPLKVCLDSIGN